MEYVSLKKIHYKQPSIEEEVYQFAHEEVIKEDPRNKLDGEIFRHGSVDIASVTGKTIHRGLYPESSIIDALTQALAILHDENMPLLARVSGFHTGCTLSKVKNQKCLLLQAKPSHPKNRRTVKKPSQTWEGFCYYINLVLCWPRLRAVCRGLRVLGARRCARRGAGGAG